MHSTPPGISPSPRHSTRPRLSPRAVLTVAVLLTLPAVGIAQMHRFGWLRGHRPIPGRASAMPLPHAHRVFGTRLDATFPGSETAMFAMGCFWGSEQRMMRLPGVLSTAVGYAGGSTPNANYEEVCTGDTGHAESVRVVFDPRRISYEQLLRVFWEGHDPTQGQRQGPDVGSQYRSVIFTFSPAQRSAALASRTRYGIALRAAGHGEITTEVRDATPFYYAEEHHQQYYADMPGGFCPGGGTGVRVPPVEAPVSR